MPPDSYQDPKDLLERMRRGDSQAAADFITRYAPLIRRRIRGKLGSDVRRLFDSQEIMSTLGRRLVVIVGEGSVRATTVGELMNLVLKIAENSVVEKGRVFRSLEAKEGEDSPLAHRMLRRLKDLERSGPEEPMIEIDRAMRQLKDGVDREILSLWLLGNEHAHIAETIGMKPPAVRKRWERIRDELRVMCEEGTC